MAIKYRTSLMDSQKYFILTVSQYQGNSISGMIYHNLREDGICYENLTDMVKRIEEISTMIDYPARCVERRSFKQKEESSTPQEKMEELEEQLKYMKPMAAFRIQIRHRYRGTWQGIAEVVDTGQQMEFVSFLELMRLIEDTILIAKKGSLAPEIPPGKHIIQIGRESFVLQLLYKEYGTWQGVLCWNRKKQQVSFRSYLEMLLLLSEACSLSKEERKIIQLKDVANR